MSNISGLGAIRKKQEEEEKRQELYAGGVDNRGGGSGLSVLGPPGNRGPANVFDSIVQKAAKPEEYDGDEPPAASGPNCRRITLYRNGFIVDDGPLRDLTSPESRAFIAKLEAGEVPPELNIPPPSGTQRGPIRVDIHLNDKRGEDYVPPPPPAYVAFSGTGVSLRSELSSSSFSSNANHVFTTESLASVAVPAVDESQPSTTLKVVLPDGKKKAIKINQSRTVQQLAAVINREAAPGGPFILSAGFPLVDLVDLNATMTEAKLLGAAVTVKKV